MLLTNKLLKQIHNECCWPSSDGPIRVKDMEPMHVLNALNWLSTSCTTNHVGFFTIDQWAQVFSYTLHSYELNFEGFLKEAEKRPLLKFELKWDEDALKVITEFLYNAKASILDLRETKFGLTPEQVKCLIQYRQGQNKRHMKHESYEDLERRRSELRKELHEINERLAQIEADEVQKFEQEFRPCPYCI